MEGKSIIAYVENRHRHAVDTSAYAYAATAPVRRLHQMIPGYKETDLRFLDELASRLGVRGIYVKDESTRFGLKAFKGLGGVYAMYRMICLELGLDAATATLEMLQKPIYKSRLQEMTFITTTDGNHGKGVSWAAGLFGCKAYVYMPKGSVEVRAEAIRKAGNAEVTITDMPYDDCVAWTAKQAAEHGWFLIQDTAWEGYEEIPQWIMQGYTTLLFEAANNMPEPPTHIFLQAGVGSMAAAIAAAARETWGELHTYIVEPTEVACFYESFVVADGLPHKATGSGITEMAGLNCAVPCSLAWELLSGLADGAFACDDSMTEAGMRFLAKQVPGVVAGESGAVTTGLLLGVDKDTIGLNMDSVILLINTEGDTDPEHWQEVVLG